MLHELLLRSVEQSVKLGQPSHILLMSGSRIKSLREAAMHLIWIAMGPRIALTDQQGYIHPKRNFHALNRIKEQKPQSLVEDIKTHHRVEGCPGPKVIFHNYLLLT